MRIRIAAIGALAFALSACGGGGGTGSSTPPLATPTPPGSTDTLPVAPEVDAQNGVATVNVTTAINPATGLPAFIYQGAAGVAPTIRVRPGDTIVMNVQNELPSSDGMSSEMNLHFHGLGVSPAAPADDVLDMLASPGNLLHYVVPIPAQQQPGLYWYHPHIFGQTDRQVGQGGMSGAIIVDGLQQDVPALAAMKERVLVVRDVADNAAAASMIRHNDGAPKGGMMPVRRPMDEDNNTNPCGPDDGVHLTVNGVAQPAIGIAPNESQFFRVINATGHRHLDLAVDGATMTLVALDGYALDTYPGAAPTRKVNDIVIPVAGRAEFVVTASPSGAQALRTQCFNAGSGGDPDDAEVLAALRSPSAPASMRANVAHAFTAIHKQPAALPAPVAQRIVTLFEDANGFYVNGKMFSMDDPSMYTVHVGTVEQWTIVNDTEEVHDFHMHQVHFALQSVNGAGVAQPQWIDTVVVPARTPGANGAFKPGSVTVLVDFRDPVIRGTFMFHCHILDHEDGGMMAKITAV